MLLGAYGELYKQYLHSPPGEEPQETACTGGAEIVKELLKKSIINEKGEIINNEKIRRTVQYNDCRG